MRRSRNIGYYERNKDALGRFVARTVLHGSITSPRTLSQPEQLRNPGRGGPWETQEEVDESQQETFSVREARKDTDTEQEQDTEQWEDVEDDEQPAWDYSDFRRRSSVLGELRWTPDGRPICGKCGKA